MNMQPSHRHFDVSQTIDGHYEKGPENMIDLSEIENILSVSYRRTWLIIATLGGIFFTLSAMAMLD